MLESIEKLRELCAKWRKTSITPGRNSAADEVDKIADEIEREIADKYIELPLDVDGVAIHPGDTLSYCYEDKPNGGELNGIEKVLYLAFDEDGEINIQLELYGWEESPQFFRYYPEEMNFRHCIKPRTIEDVLRDCCNEWNKHAGNDWESGVYAKYADELRGMGVGE